MAHRLSRLREIWTIGRGLLSQFRSDIRCVGFRAAALMFVSELTTRRPLSYLVPRGKHVLKLRLKGYSHPLYFRHGSSDLSVIRQVFCHQEYACVVDEPPPRFVVDAGANIGCTSFYLLHRFPDTVVTAIEPDRGNFDLCARNLAPFGDRVRLLKKGLWSEAAGLRVVAGTNGVGEWALEVRPCGPGEAADVEAVGMRDVLAAAPDGRIDLLKVDIEGAERQVFGDPTGWLDRVRNIVIELHGEDCERAFADALRGYRYDTRTNGELLLCSGIQAAEPQPA